MSTVTIQPDVRARSYPSLKEFVSQANPPAPSDDKAKDALRRAGASFKAAGVDVVNAIADVVNVPVGAVQAVVNLPAAVVSARSNIVAAEFQARAKFEADRLVPAARQGEFPHKEASIAENAALAQRWAGISKAQFAGMRDAGLRIRDGIGFTFVDLGSAALHLVQGAANALEGIGRYALAALYSAGVFIGVVACKVEREIEKDLKIAGKVVGEALDAVEEGVEKAIVFVGEEAKQVADAVVHGAEVVVKTAEEVVVETGKVIKEGAEAVGEAVGDAAHNVNVAAHKVVGEVARDVRDSAIDLAVDAQKVANDAKKGEGEYRDVLKRGE